MFCSIRIAVSLLLACAALALPSVALAQAVAVPTADRPALAVGAALDPSGRLWLAQVKDGRLMVSHAANGGSQFTPASDVTPGPETITADAENRPKIAVGADGIVHLSWTQNLGERMTGFIRYARSTDDCKHFSPPVTLNRDRQIISHRFDTLATNGNGGVAVAWLDARSRTGKVPKGSPQTQVGVYAAVSRDGGATFAPDRLVADHSCQCCRTGMTWTPRGPVVFWRHVFGKNIRDFAIADLAGGPLLRVTDDAWEVDGCPHHGGGIAADGRGNLHIVWFTAGANRQGIFYRRLASADFSAQGQLTGVAEMSPPLPLGQANHQPGHPAVVASGDRILLAWREFDGERYSVWAMLSADAGAHWGAPVRLAETKNAADYAVPVIDDKQALVVWNTVDEGVRVLPAEGPP
jgi:hypothetical protein